MFYVSADGEALVPVSRSVLYGATPAEQARRIVEAQVAPPTDGAVSAIPPQTVVRNVFLAGAGEAYVDLGPEIVKAHSGGSLDEALAVFAIVNALTVNLPDITSVQILIDGKEVDTLVGPPGPPPAAAKSDEMGSTAVGQDFRIFPTTSRCCFATSCAMPASARSASRRAPGAQRVRLRRCPALR